MYPFMTLNDDTEITHSEMREDGRVKVYIETPDENDGFLEYCSGWLEEHLPELAVQYCTETGELLDGMAVVEREHPATPDTIRPNGALRVKPEKVAAALGNALPATIAGLLEGGRQ